MIYLNIKDRIIVNLNVLNNVDVLENGCQESIGGLSIRVYIDNVFLQTKKTIIRYMLFNNTSTIYGDIRRNCKNIKCINPNHLYDSKNLDDVFKKNTKRLENGCLIWTLSTNKSGYGTFFYNGKVARTHRIMYSHINNITLTKKQHVCHSCDNPTCVESNHLWLGSNKENMEDRNNKKRNAFGILNGKSKINSEVAKIIKYLLKKTSLTKQEIANKTGATKAIVRSISYGKSWKYINI